MRRFYASGLKGEIVTATGLDVLGANADPVRIPLKVCVGFFSFSVASLAES